MSRIDILPRAASESHWKLTSRRPVSPRIGRAVLSLGSRMSRDQIAFGWLELDDVWEQVTAAFACYGKQIRTLRGPRRDHISRLIADGYTAEDLVAAVHGYVHWHDGLEIKPGDDFDPWKWFTPDSVFRLDKLENRIEFGASGMFVRVSRAEAIKAKQEAARARVEAARAATDGRKLRSL